MGGGSETQLQVAQELAICNTMYVFQLDDYILYVYVWVHIHLTCLKMALLVQVTEGRTRKHHGKSSRSSSVSSERRVSSSGGGSSTVMMDPLSSTVEASDPLSMMAAEATDPLSKMAAGLSISDNVCSRYWTYIIYL